ncbi:xylose isomerase [Xanthomonas arboricola]|nr:xylose isomerase [Xanthomonas arboricola]
MEVANALLTSSPLEQWRAERYASFDSGAGADFANGSSTLVDLAKYAAGNEPKQLSGRQEAYENLINQYLTR